MAHPHSDPDNGIWADRRVARRFVSPDGLVVLVGKTADDNDILTLKLAAPRDFWMHVAAESGSHVVIRICSTDSTRTNGHESRRRRPG